MTAVTTASIAYVATQVLPLPVLSSYSLTIHHVIQVRFALSSSSVFCRSDTSTDSERFYGTVLEFLDDPEEKEEVSNLLMWWNW
jgi:hypothetical protein